MALQIKKTYLNDEIFVWGLSGQASYEEWNAMLEDLSAFLTDLERRGKMVGFVVDPSGMPNIPAPQRKAAGEWRERSLALMANTCHCAAYVGTNAVMRGMLTALFWFARPTIPVKVVLSQDEGRKWLQATIAASPGRTPL